MHDRRVRDIAVGEHHPVHALAQAERLQLRLIDDRDAVRVPRSRERARVASIAEPGNLGLGERDHVHLWVVTVDHVEVMEVAAGRAEDDDPGRHDQDAATSDARHQAGRAGTALSTSNTRRGVPRSDHTTRGIAATARKGGHGSRIA